MNKTVTINISGIIFHIEEDAYENLSKYLSTIKGYFSNTEGGNEILSDIEARIAELLQGKINVSKQVILMMDVDYVTNIMGKPEDFGAENAGDNNSNTNIPNSEENMKRRLFRDPEERVIGGVCSGLGNYFNVDTVWVRLAMFMLIFFGGISLWVYVVLWIIIPIAKTTADRFAMRGESANVNNIIRSFKEEAEDVKTRFNKYGKDFKNSEYGNSIRNNAGHALHVVFNIIGRLFGLFIFLLGAVLLFAFITALFGISIADANTDISKWKSVIFESPSDYVFGIIAFIIVCGIPVFMLIYGGIKLLFRIRYSNRWFNMSLGIIWTAGLILGLYITVVTAKQFNENSRLRETVEMRGLGDTIVVKLSPAMQNLKALNLDNNDEIESYLKRNHDGYFFGDNNGSSGIISFAALNVSESNSDSVELIITKSARGITKREAIESAKAINYNYRREGNTIIFDEVYYVTAGGKFRAQELDIKLRLPKGKIIYFDKSVKHLLDDIDNTTNTWDGDMINRRWIMTNKGLKCIDCENLDNIGDDKDYDSSDEVNIKSDKVTINGKGINVRKGETQINIDENGIRIKTPDPKDGTR